MYLLSVRPFTFAVSFKAKSASKTECTIIFEVNKNFHFNTEYVEFSSFITLVSISFNPIIYYI